MGFLTKNMLYIRDMYILSRTPNIDERADNNLFIYLSLLLLLFVSLFQVPGICITVSNSPNPPSV